MQEDMPVSEYRRLLTGIMEDTPLGRTVQIRSETDPKIIASMTAHEKKIRSDWQAFTMSKNRRNDSGTMSIEQLQNLFKSFAKGG